VHKPRYLTFVLGILTAFGPMSIDMYLPAFPQIARELGVQAGGVEFTLAIYLIFVAASQLFYGTLSDRLGRRRPLMFGCALYALGSLGCSMASSLEMLIAARAVQAMGGAAGMVIARAVVRDLYDHKQSAHVFSQLMIVMAAAPILAPWVGGQVLTFGSWRLIFYVLAGFGVLCFLLAALAVPESHPPVNRTTAGLRKSLRTFGALLRHRSFVGYSLVAGFTSGGNFAYITGSAFVYITVFGVSTQNFSYFFGANAFSLIVASQMNRWLLRRFHPEQILERALSISLVSSASVLILCGLTGVGGIEVLAVLIFVCFLCSGTAFPNVAATAMAPFGRNAGSASALLGTVQFAIGGLAGATVGIWYDGTALPMTGTLAACVLGAVLALHLVARRGLTREPKEVPFAVPED